MADKNAGMINIGSVAEEDFHEFLSFLDELITDGKLETYHVYEICGKTEIKILPKRKRDE